MSAAGMHEQARLELELHLLSEHGVRPDSLKFGNPVLMHRQLHNPAFGLKFDHEHEGAIPPP